MCLRTRACSTMLPRETRWSWIMVIAHSRRKGIVSITSRNRMFLLARKLKLNPPRRSKRSKWATEIAIGNFRQRWLRKALGEFSFRTINQARWSWLSAQSTKGWRKTRPRRDKNSAKTLMKSRAKDNSFKMAYYSKTNILTTTVKMWLVSLEQEMSSLLGEPCISAHLKTCSSRWTVLTSAIYSEKETKFWVSWPHSTRKRSSIMLYGFWALVTCLETHLDMLATWEQESLTSSSSLTKEWKTVQCSRQQMASLKARSRCSQTL